MDIDVFKRLLLFVLLLLAQALVLNHIHLFDVATPFFYIYFVISFPRNYPKWAIILWSFLMGLSVDIFSNTPGVASSSMTLIGFLQPHILEIFMQRDSDDNLKPAIYNLGFVKYLYYTVLTTLTYCLVFFTVETFTFFNWKQWLLSILGSTVLTVVLIMTVDNLRKK